MTIRFAAANPEHNPVIARVVSPLCARRAANDNSPDESSDRLLKAALRHFAEHGLSAAERARALAEEAFFDNDRRTYDWWLRICRLLDRRMADAIAARSEKRGESESRGNLA